MNPEHSESPDEIKIESIEPDSDYANFEFPYSSHKGISTYSLKYELFCKSTIYRDNFKNHQDRKKWQQANPGILRKEEDNKNPLGWGNIGTVYYGLSEDIPTFLPDKESEFNNKTDGFDRYNYEEMSTDEKIYLVNYFRSCILELKNKLDSISQ